MKPEEKIILALDVSSTREAFDLAKQLQGKVGAFKIGLEFIYSLLRQLINGDYEESRMALHILRSLFDVLGGKGFLDSKLADIPNTVGKASIAISSTMGVRMFNIHASCGTEAVEAAVAARNEARPDGDCLVLGVTVLTSIKEECVSIFGDEPSSKVISFAEMLRDAGADGLIGSAQEAELLRGNREFDDLLMVTPGIRPNWAEKNDQKRVMTPAEAIQAGADYLVIGRPIRQPPPEIGSPADAAERIAEEIASAQQRRKE